MLSIILLSYYSGERIVRAYEQLNRLMEAEQIHYELIVMDDGSTDNSFAIAAKLASEHDNVKAYQLSRNYTSHYSIFAGLSVCSGRCATAISDDEQQPYGVLVTMYRLWKAGNHVIIPHRIERSDGLVNNLMANIYYKLVNFLSDITFPPGGADSFLIDREVIDLINVRIHAINTSIITEILRMGFSPVFVPYRREKGINQKSRWTLKNKTRLFKDTFYSCSTTPIKLITRLGLFFSGLALIMIALYSYIAIWGNPQFWGEKLPGWTSTIVIIAFFSGTILFSLGIIAEYIWRIYEEVKNRPGYIIKKNQDKDSDKYDPGNLPKVK
jgi:polyisoprenyl-phosphate glycosyltransferase